MHEERKKAINRKIHKVLSSVNLSNKNIFSQQFGTYLKDLHTLIAKENEFNLISESDLSTIVLSQIADELFESKQNKSTPLTNRIEKKIANVLFSIPIKYTIRLNVPIFKGEHLFNFDQLSIPFSLSNARSKKTGLLDEFLKGVDNNGINKLNNLTFVVHGYLNDTSNRTSRKAMSLVKVLIQRALSNELYVLKKYTSEEKIKGISSALFKAQNIKSIPEYFLEYKSYQDEEFKKINLTDAFSCFLDLIEFNLNNKSLKDNIESNSSQFLLKTIEETKLLINSEDSHITNVAAAIEWYLDACIYEDKNISFSFLQICFGLEALFSDDPKLISKTLSLKCAYSIGRSKDERNRIINLIQDLYTLRSKIVHGSKLSIDEDEINLFQQGKIILKISIDNELSLAMHKAGK